MPLRGDFQKLIGLHEASPRPNVVHVHATAIPHLQWNNIRHTVQYNECTECSFHHLTIADWIAAHNSGSYRLPFELV